MKHLEQSREKSQLVREYHRQREELSRLENKIDNLETYLLQTWQGGNYYIPEINIQCTNKEAKPIDVPPHCKLFSLSSCCSKAYCLLENPGDVLSLQLLDKTGRRLTHVKLRQPGKRENKKTQQSNDP